MVPRLLLCDAAQVLLGIAYLAIVRENLFQHTIHDYSSPEQVTIQEVHSQQLKHASLRAVQVAIPAPPIAAFCILRRVGAEVRLAAAWHRRAQLVYPIAWQRQACQCICRAWQAAAHGLVIMCFALADDTETPTHLHFSTACNDVSPTLRISHHAVALSGGRLQMQCNGAALSVVRWALQQSQFDGHGNGEPPIWPQRLERLKLAAQPGVLGAQSLPVRTNRRLLK